MSQQDKHGEPDTTPRDARGGATGNAPMNAPMNASVDAQLARLHARIAELEAEHRRVRTQERLHLLFVEAAHEGLWAIDVDQRTTYVNTRMAEMLGTTVVAMLGTSLFDFMDEQGTAVCLTNLEKRRRGITEEHDFLFMRRDGRRILTRMRTSPIMDEAGAYQGAVALVEDITAERSAQADVLQHRDDSRRADDALAAGERRYRDLVETSQDLIWSTDAAGCWTFVNRAATLRIYGREPAELIGHPFTELQTPEQQARDMVVFKRILTGEKYFEYETVHLHKDGTEVHLSFNAIVMRDAEGRVAGATGTAKDITERRRAEAEREELNMRMLQAQKLESLGVLAGGIAHDFNNLLVGILGNAGLALMELPAGAPGRQAVEGVCGAAQRAADLARQMLAYSGRGKFVVEALDVSRLVEELGHLLSAVISKQAVLHLDVAAGLPPIDGDATQLRQVVMNLITNASDALGEAGGAITVTTGVMHADAEYLAGTAVPDELAPGRYVFISVSDTGAGMDDTTKARLFEPFYTTKFTGRGLGLAAVLGILRSHHGAIRVDSAVGRGTTMRILLPPAPAATLPAAPPADQAGTHEDSRRDAAPQRAAWRGTGCVLVVDDEEMVRDVLRSVLEYAGFVVLTAPDGPAALELYRQRRAEIVAVLLDLTMPRLSGEETFRQLQHIDPGVKVILTSGYTEQDATQPFAGRGLAGFVRKPSSPEELLACLRAALES